ARYLGEKKYGNFIPGLSEASLQVANDCVLVHTVAQGEQCLDIATASNVSISQIVSLNPTLHCQNLIPGSLVCIQKDTGTSNTSGTTSGTGTGTTTNNNNNTTTTTTTSININCIQTYTTATDDTCTAISSLYSLTMDQFNELNPDIICSASEYLQPGLKICVEGSIIGNTAIIGGPGDSNFTTTPTTTANATTTPTTGLIAPVSGCKKLINVTVSFNDRLTCDKIAFDNGISITDLYNWNLGLDCWRLKSGDQVCVNAPKGVTVTRSKSTPASSSTPTSSITSSVVESTSSSDVSTPTPTTTADNGG
ncbi:hypothetical protein HDU76_011777, partial [Blyttiomyces sp. JEL0837]